MPVNASILSVIVLALMQNASAAEGPAPVSVGMGSYAGFPPSGEGKKGDKIAEVLTKKLYLDESKAGVSIPTNQWWTALLMRQYGGNLWAHPLTVTPDDSGLKIFHPTRWNEKGTEMVLDLPIAISGEVQAQATASPDIVVADFEAESFPPGWQKTGDAFGPGPSKGALPGQSAASGFLGKGLANSIHNGDKALGTLTSPEIAIQRKYVHFLIAGGKNPDALRFNLLVAGKSARSATGENSGRLKWQTWDVSEFKGKRAVFQAEDNASGGWSHLMVDHIVQSDEASPPSGKSANSFAPKDSRVLNWGDWTVAFRMRQSPQQLMDVTLGHGIPFVWMEFKGVSPIIQSGADATYFDQSGAALSFPAGTDQLGIEYGGRFYGVFAPDGAVFQRSGETVTVKFTGPKTYLIVSALPSKDALTKFHDCAFAIPRSSRLSWTYDPAKAEVTTHWTLDTESLKGTNRDVIQGWIPHHYRDTNQQLAFNGIEYPSARGLLKCASGHEFTIGYPFNGLLPALPKPQVAGYDEGRMRSYITEYATKKVEYGNDTYWGGKDVLCYARYMSMAKELGSPEFETLRDITHKALADWLTYTPGEKAHYFARYPQWKALVGFSESYGSGEFNDQHFHYGYFTTAAGLLGLDDPQFLKDYGAMVKLVAKEYANWDHQDLEFPFLRTFDVWEGHSWAGGFSSPGGNNQESSSEAMQSWGGLFLLGTAMGDKQMTAAGAMGHAMESAATRTYWFDYYGYKDGPKAAVFPPEYKHKITGIFQAGGRAYATYFSGDPGWIYGIQTLPVSPFLSYLGRDLKFAKWQFDNMMADRAEKAAAKGQNHEKENTIKSMGGLGSVILGAAVQFDPEWAATQMDQLWADKADVVTKDNMRGIIYYLAHANRMLGQIDWTSHTSIPTSTVYTNPATNKRTWVIYNPQSKDELVTAYTEGKPVGTAKVPAHSLARVSELLPLK